MAAAAHWFAAAARGTRNGATLEAVLDPGNAPADLVLGVTEPPDGRVFAALRRGWLSWPEVSELAGGDEVARALWEDSARLVGLAPSAWHRLRAETRGGPQAQKAYLTRSHGACPVSRSWTRASEFRLISWL